MSESSSSDSSTVELPASTGWPLVVAAALAFTLVGVMTDLWLSLAGIVILAIGIGGWIRELTPGRGHVHHPLVPADQRASPVVRSERTIAASRAGFPEHRQRFPEEIHPYSSSAMGGFLAGMVMMGLAVAHSLVWGKGLFYNMNLLSAIVLPRYRDASPEVLMAFDGTSLMLALLIHIVASVSVGLMFGLVLPMLPRSPFYWAGFVAPLMWSGFVYGLMGVINPLMNDHIDWFWFVVCQFAFGLTLGWYIVRGNKLPAWGRFGRIRKHARKQAGGDRE